MPVHTRVPRAEFKRMRGFKRLNGTLFMLSWGAIPGRDAAGAAVVVSKKAASRASDRNLIKRRVRAVLARLIQASDAPTVFVVYAKKAANTAAFAEIEADIQALVARARTAR